jgi:hypothetical protein
LPGRRSFLPAIDNRVRRQARLGTFDKKHTLADIWLRLQLKGTPRWIDVHS